MPNRFLTQTEVAACICDIIIKTQKETGATDSQMSEVLEIFCGWFGRFPSPEKISKEYL
jgi:hypothetical protein